MVYNKSTYNLSYCPMNIFHKHNNLTDIARAVLLVTVVLTAINVILGGSPGVDPVTAIWYVINVLMLVAPAVFIATGIKSVKHWHIVAVLLLLPAIATIYQLVVGVWGDSDPNTIWTVVNTYVPIVYAYLVGSNFSLCICSKK